jgi:hypothetical protein
LILIHEKLSDLDGLYAVALRTAGPWKDSHFAQDARAVLAAVVLGKCPMSDTTIDALLHGSFSSPILGQLGCVVQWAPGQEAQILHASFGDYLTDRKHCGGKPWYIDPKVRGHQLASRCFQVMKADLRFNICRLEDSHIHNSDVHKLPEHIMTYISPQLSYSSRFWADHLDVADFDNGMLEDIRLLIYSKFLYWLEVLSVLQETAIVTNALTTAAKLAEVSPLYSPENTSSCNHSHDRSMTKPWWIF